ncbi:hypothetical protein JTB14_009823 [Gonioctena quinquepunctata]|nr:hypothetical protein JTB14_009823 [Gonioctena quinquepunctata]
MESLPSEDNRSEKEGRQRKREELKQEKEKLKQTSKKKHFIKNDDKDEVSSDSSIDMILDSEGEGADWDSSTEVDFGINDYVIVRYEHNYYPGKIIELDAENAETKVSTLMRSGIQDRKLPNYEDIM